MKIGNLELGDRPLLLAPMEDVTNPPFRLLCKQYGADLTYTEFISADALIRDVNRTVKKLTILAEERPVAIQIYGKEVDSMTQAAIIAEQANPEFIDLNFGCPVRKVATKGAGAGLLQNTPLMLDIIESVSKAVKLPVSVKTRLGWDAENKIIVELAEQIQDRGAAALTIHGRTRCQMYKGEADWTLIGEVKNNQRMTIPIIGNGDICDPIAAENAFNKYGVDAVMIGRASIGKPWVFEEIKHYFKTGELLSPKTVRQQVEMIDDQVRKACEWIDEKRGILHMRRHMANMFKCLYNFKQTRIDMLRANTMEELEEVFQRIIETWGDE
ncbi:MAG: tRNA dihydrouridine synthase DusB [Marinifilaceae bacterium]|jgi:nifR3 family TIM-barrel protein|nr:tRNA dihydrouridine synthase DusB [Marinifilaceae bacterium]